MHRRGVFYVGVDVRAVVVYRNYLSGVLHHRVYQQRQSWRAMSEMNWYAVMATAGIAAVAKIMTMKRATVGERFAAVVSVGFQSACAGVTPLTMTSGVITFVLLFHTSEVVGRGAGWAIDWFRVWRVRKRWADRTKRADDLSRIRLAKLSTRSQSGGSAADNGPHETTPTRLS